MFWRVNLVFILIFAVCSGVINQLNDTEYDRMPPLFAMDDFGRCMVHDNGTYCLVRLDLYAEPGNELMTLIQEYSANTIKHYNHSFLQRAVCVSRACSKHVTNHSLRINGDLVDVLEGCLNESMYDEYGVQGKVSELYYCERKGEGIEIDTFDWVVLGIYGTILLVNLIGTIYDIVHSNTADSKGNKYLLSFSVIQNWRRLVSPETEEVKIKKLQGFHGARVLTLFLMFTSHVMWIHSMGIADNIHEFEQLYESTYYQLIFNGLVVVQVFFGMSGFLLVYNLEWYADTHDISWAMAPRVWVMRWWRLTPAYAVVLLFMATWLRHIGSGPLWRFFVADTVVADCRTYWWAHLLYINNYIDDGHFCAIHTWHIASDTQLFCIGLLAYMVTRKGGRYVVFSLLVLLGVILPAAHVWAWDLDGLVLITPEFYRTMLNPTFHNMHAYGHNNIICYVMGMTTGYFVYRLQKKNVDISNNKVYIFLAWLCVPCIALLFYSGSIFYEDGERASVWLRASYASGHMLVMGVIVCFGMVAFAMKVNTVLREMFEWRVWLIPSRLSYSVYLLHIFLIHAHIGLMTQLTHASTFNLTIFHFGVLLFSFMIALPFSMMVEAPLMRLMKIATCSEPRESTKV